MKDNILQNANNPKELEKLYRKDAKSFTSAFRQIPPESISSIYEFWDARLRFDEDSSADQRADDSANPVSIGVIVLLAIVAGTIAKIPDLFDIEEEFFYSRFLAFALFPVLSAYFILGQQLNKRAIAVVSALFAVALVYMGFLPELEKSDSIILSFIHLPFFLWTVTGIAFIGIQFKSIERRIAYVKFNGELAIYTAILLIAGAILTGLTAGLFSVIDVDIMEKYMRWVVVFGAAATPIVGAYLVSLRSKGSTRISPVIARIFAPLFLVTLIVYLVVIVLQGKSPFTDREFLIIFNGMLLLVLAICIFSITENQIALGQKWVDITILALLIVGLIVDLVALSAILFRLGSYGFTPNRIAVLGANIIVCINAAGLFFYFGQYVRRKRELKDAIGWIAGYLPVYAVWTAFIVFIFPLLYRFK